ncbi:MAG: hypothetical protein QOG01_494 [Pseudonocardiales bacterium]|jgi:DNA-binding MarR family transcriptional regulator|nr:hypothetical protein [Pseudonocardiales bacterium]
MSTEDRGRPAASDLALRLESAFRLLGKRIYLPSVHEMRALNRDLDRASIPLLAALEERDDLRPSDVAAAVELDLSTVSRQLRQLEMMGLVTRRPDSVDGRARRLTLTTEGRQALQRIRGSRAAMLDEVFHDWPEAERAGLLRLLDRLLVGLNALPARTSVNRISQEEASLHE